MLASPPFFLFCRALGLYCRLFVGWQRARSRVGVTVRAGSALCVSV